MKSENVAWQATEHACLQALSETGATGLEPATSGVTGHFQDRDMGDGGRRIAHFVRFLGSGSHRPRMVELRNFPRLLPVCCPG
jgi:hypothetical protein